MMPGTEYFKTSCAPSWNRRDIRKESLFRNVQYFGHLMQRADSLGKTLILRKIEGRRRRGQEEKGATEDEMASPTQWT